MRKLTGGHTPVLERELTQGSETSQYLEEKKANAIPLIAASETGSAQTECSNTRGVVGQIHQ